MAPIHRFQHIRRVNETTHGDAAHLVATRPRLPTPRPFDLSDPAICEKVASKGRRDELEDHFVAAGQIRHPVQSIAEHQPSIHMLAEAGMDAPANAGQVVMLWQRTVRGAEWFDPPIVCKEEARSPDAERRVVDLHLNLTRELH